jgi:hypothetical protein
MLSPTERLAIEAARAALARLQGVTYTPTPKWVGGHLFVTRDHCATANHAASLALLDEILSPSAGEPPAPA